MHIWMSLPLDPYSVATAMQLLLWITYHCRRSPPHLSGLLAVPASSGVKLPPLECLFTVEEEIGLVGAFNLDGSMVKGRTMLNLVSRGVKTSRRRWWKLLW